MSSDKYLDMSTIYVPINKAKAIELLAPALLATGEAQKQWYLWQIARMLDIDQHPTIAQLNTGKGIAPHE